MFLAGLLDRFERDRRFASVRRAYAQRQNDDGGDHAELVQLWDRATTEDLDRQDDDLEGDW